MELAPSLHVQALPNLPKMHLRLLSTRKVLHNQSYWVRREVLAFLVRIQKTLGSHFFLDIQLHNSFVIATTTSYHVPTDQTDTNSPSLTTGNMLKALEIKLDFTIPSICSRKHVKKERQNRTRTKLINTMNCLTDQHDSQHLVY